MMDLEKGDVFSAVSDFSFHAISAFTTSSSKSADAKAILSEISGHVQAGEMLAMMGPSGSGKTSLLDLLARRSTLLVKGKVLVNGQSVTNKTFRKISAYVEQEDALIGSLTVKETVMFAAKLALLSSVSSQERAARVDAMISSLGLEKQKDLIIGTPLKKGISGGQKRRVSVGAQLVTMPKIVFLDEVTSGLDSVASYEVTSCIKSIAKANNMIVVASIHQPSTKTFSLFDKVLLLSGGRQVYFGPTSLITNYFSCLGHEIPAHYNPAEFCLDITNTDFETSGDDGKRILEGLFQQWDESSEKENMLKDLDTIKAMKESSFESLAGTTGSEHQARAVGGEANHAMRGLGYQVIVLLHRSLVKSYRDPLAYGIRIVMYLGLAIMMGTVWLRLDTSQDSIQNIINALFFGSAFMSFMAVSYIPAYLEDQESFVKERANGLYGPTAFMLSNTIIGVPFLFLITVLFSVVTYWLINLQPTATRFFTYILYLFLDLLAAESLVVLVSVAIPIFVGALTATAFANGLWMSVSGFLVEPKILNDFWYYTFYWIDYQRYVFVGLMNNELSGRTYDCGSGCHCMFNSELASECKIAGQAVLDARGYGKDKTGLWIGVLLALIVVMRVAAWVLLVVKRK